MNRNKVLYTQVVPGISNMSIRINSETYYRTSEVCRMVGISRNTLFRWLKDGVFDDVEHRDWRGWRLFTEDQIDKMKAKTCQINSIDCRPASVLTRRCVVKTDISVIKDFGGSNIPVK